MSKVHIASRVERNSSCRLIASWRVATFNFHRNRNDCGGLGTSLSLFWAGPQLFANANISKNSHSPASGSSLAIALCSQVGYGISDSLAGGWVILLNDNNKQ